MDLQLAPQAHHEDADDYPEDKFHEGVFLLHVNLIFIVGPR
jgi:hypothetical protein